MYAFRELESGRVAKRIELSDIFGYVVKILRYTVAFISLLFIIMGFGVLLAMMLAKVTNDERNLAYGIVVASGSTSSRLDVFYWNEMTDWFGVIPSVYELKATMDKNHNFYPAVDKFLDDSEGLTAYLTNITDTAKRYVPADKWWETPLLLFGTAGVRDLGKDTSKRLIDNITTVLEDLAFLPSDVECVKVLSGNSESAYGWLGANYILGSIPNHHLKKKMEVLGKNEFVGSIDLGGGSLEIAFQVDDPGNIPAGYEHTLELDDTLSLNLFADSVSNAGVNSVRKMHMDNLTVTAGTGDTRDPCLPVQYSVDYTNTQTQISKHVVGDSNYTSCLQSLSHVLEINSTCSFNNCSGFGHFIPPLENFPPLFILHSTFGYLQDALGFPQNATLDIFETSVRNFCSLSLQEQIEMIPNTVPEKIAVKYCFSGVWGLLILKHWFKLGEAGSSLLFTNEINDYPVGWTMGAILAYLHDLPLSIAHARSFLEGSSLAIIGVILVVIEIVAFVFASFVIFSTPRRMVRRIWDKIRGPKSATGSAGSKKQFAPLEV